VVQRRLIEEYEVERKAVPLLLSNKQKRAYRGILNGMEMAYKRNKRIRFLTLTTSELQYENIDFNDLTINENFRRLKQRIKRMTVAKLIQQGYIKSSDCRRYYEGVPLTQPFDFDYFKVKTNEGNGVLHTLYKGEYLPYNYLVDNWTDLHNTWDINIKLINHTKYDFKRASNYVVTQYLSNQGSSYQRSSQSWGWTIRGYNKEFYKFLQQCKTRYFYNSIEKKFYKNRIPVNIFKEWMEYLMKITKKPPPSQMSLTGGIAS
jgi:hypothetical protein